MKALLWASLLLVLVAACQCERNVQILPDEDSKDDVVVVEISDDAKNKRQTAQERSGGATQHIQYGSPGHYLLRTSKEVSSEPDPEYLSLLQQLEGGQQSAAAQQVPAVQQYIIQRQPQHVYQQAPLLQRQPKILHVQPSEKRLLSKNSHIFQQGYQNQKVPLVLRPSQAVKPSPVQGIYTNQGFLPNNGHALHEARVQAALSVAEDKPVSNFNENQQLYQFSHNPQPSIGDSSFEKELAELVAANQALELKSKPQRQQQQQYRFAANQGGELKPKLQQQQYQYVQQSPPRHTYIISSSPKPKQYAPVPSRLESQVPKHIPQTITGRSKNPQQLPQHLPQQYLIETTKPQPVQQTRPAPQRVRPQYVQATTEEPQYIEYQPYQDNSALKVVNAPQLQRTQSIQQYTPIVQKPNEPSVPEYLQYYQSIAPQTEEGSSSNDVKLDPYYRINVPKPQPKPTPSPSQEQPSYIRFESHTKAAEPVSYIRYKSPKPQASQYSNNDDELIQSLLEQSLKKAQQSPSAFAASKSEIAEPKPKVSSLSETPHSSIFVSKAIVPKKANTAVTIESSQNSEPDEELPTVRLPPPKNSKVYTQEEFQALIAAGYSVTPVPVLEDEDSQPNFSPAPVNYPGHKQFRGSFVTSPAPEQQYYEKQSTESYVSSTQAPRKRKQRRPTPRPQYRQQVDTEYGQSESESQSNFKYSSPLETEETGNYGMKKQSRGRGQTRRQHAIANDSET